MAKIKMSSVKGKGAKTDIKPSKKSPKSKSEVPIANRHLAKMKDIIRNSNSNSRDEDMAESDKKFTLIMDFMLGTGECDVFENGYGLQSFDKLFMLREENCGHYYFKISIREPEYCDYVVISTIHLSEISHAEIKQLFKYMTEELESYNERRTARENERIAQFKDVIYKRIEPKALYDAICKKD